MAQPGSASAVEEPPFDVVVRDGAFEVRDYAPAVVAETRLQGERDRAINGGFRRLARYIFGGNEPQREIAMTAPVTQRQSGDRIAMTAPVTQVAADAGWTIAFFMPPGSRLADMPRPLDAQVELRETPPRRVAVVRFSGWATGSNLARHEAELRERLAARGDTAAGPVTYAFYDPPWTLPWLRRNEVMVEIGAP